MRNYFTIGFIALATIFYRQPEIAQGQMSSNYRSVYWILNAGKPGTPSLSKNQADWIKTVTSNPYWRARIRHLWFYPEPSAARALTIFYVEDWALHQGSDHTGNKPNGDTPYYIVGEKCTEGFVRYKGIDAFSIPPVNMSASWPPSCYYDPFGNTGDKGYHPPIPPSAPTDSPYPE